MSRTNQRRIRDAKLDCWNRTVGELVGKNQTMSSRLQNALDRLAGISAENQSLKAALKTSASASVKPATAETCCQHRGRPNVHAT